MNNKATLGPQVMVFLFILNLLIITGGIVFGVTSFFTQDYDFREIDANLLNTKITECLAKENMNLENIPNEIYKLCKINKEVTDEYFFIYIKKDGSVVFESGPGDETQCALAEKNKNFHFCVSSEISEKKLYIQTGSSQNSRRLKT